MQYMVITGQHAGSHSLVASSYGRWKSLLVRLGHSHPYLLSCAEASMFFIEVSTAHHGGVGRSTMLQAFSTRF